MDPKRPLDDFQLEVHASRPRKRHKTQCVQGRQKSHQEEGGEIYHPVLNSYYRRILKLRQWLLEGLERYKASNKRRTILKHDQAESELLDGVLVGVPATHSSISGWTERDISNAAIWQNIAEETSAIWSSSRGTAASNGGGGRNAEQYEVVDCAIWLLFNKLCADAAQPTHLLCRGYQRSSSTDHIRIDAPNCDISGLVLVGSNKYASSLRSPQWHSVLNLLGAQGYPIMLDLLLNCGLFAPIQSSLHSAADSLGGLPISDFDALQTMPDGSKHPTLDAKQVTAVDKESKIGVVRKPSEITFVRHRMLYAKPTLNLKGKIHFGLQHIHVLNRCPENDTPVHTEQLLKYIFPRQFRLHNVFTSVVDPRETAQPFKDYTVREEVTASSGRQTALTGKTLINDSSPRPRLPKRLRGAVFELISKLQTRHARCSYRKLLNHYCPTNIPMMMNDSTPRFTEIATANAQVSAFCRAVVLSVLPFELLGESDAHGENWKTLMFAIDKFIGMRRFESLTLEDTMQRMRISKLTCFQAISVDGRDRRMAKSDFDKRSELLAEIVYWIFDSFLIPLIRCNFYVTESATHRNRLFYFRQDVWQRMIDPAKADLKQRMLEPMDLTQAAAALEGRMLGYSQLRFLPKNRGVRPISNLKRRMPLTRHGTSILGKSINSLIAPAFNVLNFEKMRHPEVVGSSIFSVSGIHEKLRAFRERLHAARLDDRKLYFAKVDVRACFDTLPQDRLVELASRLCESEEYGIHHYTEVKPGLRIKRFGRSFKPIKKFHARATKSDGDSASAISAVEKVGHHPDAVLSDCIQQKTTTKAHTLQLLRQHVQENVVRIGKNYWRQKKGIPQGSILSSLLCSLCYTEFEEKHLSFLSQPCLFMRLIDDFMLITPFQNEATRFLGLMFRGIKEYGISVRPEKCLSNFDARVQGYTVSRLDSSHGFPYCGVLIDERTLDISKDLSTTWQMGAGDSLTVEYSKLPGQTFRRKMLNALKIQMQTMLFDTSHNDVWSVSSNVFQVLIESAIRSVHYIKSVRGLQRAAPALIWELVEDLAALAFAKMKSKRNRDRCKRYQCSISRNAVQWLTTMAFVKALQPRQASYQTLLTWLSTKARRSKPRMRREGELLEQVVETFKGGQLVRD